VSGPDGRTNRALDRLEQISKIIAGIGIPLVVALFGWLIQRQLNAQSIGRDYVQLAVSILKEPKKDGDQELREWAVALMNANSPIKFGEATSTKLSSGELSLPSTDLAYSEIHTQLNIFANLFLGHVDSGDYAGAWDRFFDPSYLPAPGLTREEFLMKAGEFRKPLGKPAARILISEGSAGDPKHPLVYTLRYRTTFQDGKASLENIWVDARPTQFKVVGYLLEPAALGVRLGQERQNN